MILSIKEMYEANERVRLVKEKHWDTVQLPQPTIPDHHIIDFGYDYDGDDFDGTPIQRKYIITYDGEKHYV